MGLSKEWCYTCWKDGEPNEWEGYTENHLGTWSNYGWNWNDEHENANIVGLIMETGTYYGPSCSAPVPEPATIILLGSGLLCAIGLRRKKK